MGERSHRVERVPAKDRGVAVTVPQDAQKRGRRKGRQARPRSTNATDRTEITDFRGGVLTKTPRKGCNTRKQGHKGHYYSDSPKLVKYACGRGKSEET